MKVFSITRGNIVFGVRSDTFRPKNFVNTNLKITFNLEGNFLTRGL